MNRFGFLVLVAALVLGGCTALDQFPERSNNYNADLSKLDCDYAKALAKINGEAEEVTCPAETGKTGTASTGTASTATGSAGTTSTGTTNTNDSEDNKVRIRNNEIDKRLAVIDANFENFRIALSQENVKSDFGVSLVEVGVGGTGALVAETASQILSAVSGGLAGAQAAYGKAALYEKALSALLAQMIASRKAVLVRILQGRKASYDDYPLSAAVHDLDAYYFAGSLPGAIVATSADAQVKNNEADQKIKRLVVGPVPPDLQKRREAAAAFVKTLNQAQLDRLAQVLDLQTGERALIEILTAISAAETTESFDAIAQQLTILFNQEV